MIDDDVLQFSVVRSTAVCDTYFLMHVSVLLLKSIAEFKQSCFIAVTKKKNEIVL